MNHQSRISRHDVAHDFFTFGHEGLGLSRAAELRAAERERDELAATLRAPGTPSIARRWLGDLMISLGTGIAGKQALAPRCNDLATRPALGASR